jgi:hypothetical protein
MKDAPMSDDDTDAKARATARLSPARVSEMKDDNAEAIQIDRRHLGLAVGAVVVAVVSTWFSYFVAEVWIGELVWQPFFLANFIVLVGLPVAATVSFAIVVLFYTRFHGQLEFKVFGLSFSGPGAPVMLWIACLLSFVTAIAILTKLGALPAQPSTIGWVIGGFMAS